MRTSGARKFKQFCVNVNDYFLLHTPGITTCRGLGRHQRHTLTTLQSSLTETPSYHASKSLKHTRQPYTLTAHRHSYCTISAVEYERVSEETLESLCERFDELNELESCPPDFDVTYSAGVLTVSLGGDHGTYVINKQTPNTQIWLSSPHSGPKRYDYINGRWIYKQDNTNLHELLSCELQTVFGSDSDFSSCSCS